MKENRAKYGAKEGDRIVLLCHRHMAMLAQNGTISDVKELSEGVVEHCDECTRTGG